MVLRSGVMSSRPGLISITGRFWWAKVLSSATGFQPGSKSRWLRTSRVVHCPGASLLSRYGSIPRSCALSCAQALFARPRRSLTVACAMAPDPPIPESTALFDHLIGPPEQRRRDRKAEGLGGFEVDDQLELRGLLDRQVTRLGALENFLDVDGGTAEEVRDVSGIAEQAPRFHEFTGADD